MVRETQQGYGVRHWGGDGGVMNHDLERVQQDLKRIWRRLILALGEQRAAAFEEELLALLRQFDRGEHHGSVAQEVRQVIEANAADDEQCRRRVNGLLDRTQRLSLMGQYVGEIDHGITPKVYYRTSVTAGGRPSNARHVLVPIWYATDRNHEPGSSPSKRFGTKRGEAVNHSPMRYGKVIVSIPDIHKAGLVESAAWYRLEFREDPNRHVMVREVTEIGHGRWMKELQAEVHDEDILVFVHGYNATWADAAKRAAQITFDMDFRGQTVMFTWPSKGRLLGYKDDRFEMDWTAPHFKDLLVELLASSGARRIHIIAHSMGNELTTRALRDIADSTEKYPTPVREVVFAAPDVEVEIFTDFAVYYNDLTGSFSPPVAPRLTLYVCALDVALGFSKRLYNKDLTRAGDSRQGRIIALPMDTVEVAAKVLEADPDDDPWAHGYFCTNKMVLKDLGLIVVDGKRADQRGLKMKMQGEDQYWLIT